MRENAVRHDTAFSHRTYGKKDGASFQIIVLGPSGGPVEDSITGLLVRAPQSEWRKSSVIAVDAGAHLASIIRILEQDMPLSSKEKPPTGHKKVLKNGPFADIQFPGISAKANSLWFFREMVHSFLITHPHLDHISGMAINTPALEYGREAKAIVALPSTIEAIKNHIFNDSIWPNLSDESHGVGFVTYRRLIEGGNPRLGYGEARGYVNVCEGLATKCWSVSHGKCHRRQHSSANHARGDSFGWTGNEYNVHTRRLSRISDDHGYFAAVAMQQAQNAGGYAPAVSAQMSMPVGQVTPGVPGGTAPSSAVEANHLFEPVSSSAFFIRNDVTGHEILVFGDIEPDSVSMSPRNHIVWDDAAPKFDNGLLKAIFIECSYDDSVRNEDLYGHLCPRHLIAELTFLAYRVLDLRKQKDDAAIETDFNADMDKSPLMLPTAQQPLTATDSKRKRKRTPNGEIIPESPVVDGSLPPQPIDSPHVRGRSTTNSRRKTSHGPMPAPQLGEQRPSTPGRGRAPQAGPPPTLGQHQAGTIPIMSPGMKAGMAAGQARFGPSIITTHHTPSMLPQQTPIIAPKEKLKDVLKGLSVHIIHVKETLLDGPSPGEVIIGQLQALSEEAGLGAEFEYTTAGESIWV